MGGHSAQTFPGSHRGGKGHGGQRPRATSVTVCVCAGPAPGHRGPGALSYLDGAVLARGDRSVCSDE